MKATVSNHNVPKERPFPKLMICTSMANNGMIVLFHEPMQGYVLKGSSNWKAGQTCGAFDMEVFRDFEGTITLSND